MTSTPFLRVPFNEGIWVKTDGASMGRSGVSWWSLNPEHDLFKEGRPYYGVLHGEVISRDDEDVVNLSFETGEGAQVFSLGFKRDSDDVSFLLEAQDKDKRKALRLACELLHHFPEKQIKDGLVSRVGKQLSVIEFSVPQKVWDRV